MLFEALSAAVFGIDAYPVEVEVDITAGNAFLTTFGLRTRKSGSGLRCQRIRPKILSKYTPEI
jgi:hypothetical protein